MTLEERINSEVEYWVDEWEDGDFNLFKLELNEDECVDNIDDKLISEFVSDIYQKGNYAYIQLNYTDLKNYYNEKIKEWNQIREQDIKSYWSDKL